MQTARKSLLSRFFMVLAILLAMTPLLAQSPGTPADPLVSKSYIDHFLRFKSMVLPANGQIKPEAGSMIVVRSGQIRLEAPKGKTVIDLTAGREIAGGTDLPLNHLLIVPDSGDYLLKARNLTLLLASCLPEDKGR
jgi:hypothetical protein